MYQPLNYTYLIEAQATKGESCFFLPNPNPCHAPPAEGTENLQPKAICTVTGNLTHLVGPIIHHTSCGRRGVPARLNDELFVPKQVISKKEKVFPDP